MNGKHKEKYLDNRTLNRIRKSNSHYSLPALDKFGFVHLKTLFLQEIDGQALMLLKADHLMSAMAIKLGPALKICSAIDAMREELKQVNYQDD